MRTGKTSRAFKAASLLLTVGIFSGCAQSTTLKPIETMEYVNLDKFMGDWYVIANIPTALEKNIYNAVETYELNEDGTIATTFTFNKGSFDGKKKAYRPKGFIYDTKSNAIWGMRFIWPIKADYRVVYVDEDYNYTIIGRSKRDYVWIMARTPTVSKSVYEDLIQRTADQGYDMSLLREVPQQTLK